jgi:hypothetical protein
MPDFAARLAIPASGRTLAGWLVRQVRVENAGVAARAGGWGVSAGGKLFLNEDKTADARFMVTYGRNIGRYVGLNFAPDAVYVPATGNSWNVPCACRDRRGAGAAWQRACAINLMGSYQSRRLCRTALPPAGDRPLQQARVERGGQPVLFAGQEHRSGHRIPPR